MEQALKVEIAESLASSWLRHVQGCVVAQTNWKPSPTWAPRKGAELGAAFDQVRAAATERIQVEIFRRGNFDQFIRQAEVDVLGLRLSPSGRTALAVDTAFHGDGLIYGDANGTVGRVLKKLVRAAFALEAYIDVDEMVVVFATPKVAEPILRRIVDYLEELEALLAHQPVFESHPRFRVVANQDFNDEILRPVVEQASTVADTSDLFMRAQQLLNLCDPVPRARARPAHAAPAGADDAVKIGQHVQQTMEELATAARLDDAS